MNNSLAVQTDTNSNAINQGNNNVVGFYNDSPQEEINNFMALRNSENTKTSYWNHYGHMFMHLTNREINQLTWDDIKKITKKRVKAYRVSMMDQNFKNSTINQRVYACKKLWKEFIENERVSDNAFELEDLLEEDNHYDSLTTKEVEMLFDYCLELKHKPETQSLYFRFLYIVACRKNTAQTLKWENIIRKSDPSGNEFWVIKFHEKGGDYERAITDEFFQELKDNYKNNNETSGKVFNVHNHTIDKVLKGFCEKFGITRHIVQHSIRGSASDNIQNILGDINITAKALGHQQIQTTYDKYMNKNDDFVNQPSYMLYKNFNIDMLKGLGEDVLIRLIENSGKDVVIKLCLELDKQGKK